MWALITMALAMEPWQAENLAAAEARIAAQPGGELLMQVVKAHGGLEPWTTAGSIAFDYDSSRVGAPDQRRYTRSQVNLSDRRAVQVELGEGADAKLGYDGQESWIVPTPESFPSSPSFWAVTPFYFVGIPWVFADPGVKVDVLAPIVIPQTGVDEPLPSLKVTFEAGTGDAPDDFYIVHTHPETHQIVAIRYIVSSPKIFPEGGHSPEKISLWSGFSTVDGLLFPGHFESHAWSEAGVGELKGEVSIDNVALGDVLPDEVFAPPATPVGGLDHLGLTVPDLAASRAFFLEVLGFRVRGGDPSYPAWFLTNGSTTVTLWQADAGAVPFDRRKNVGLHHLALSVDSFEALDALHRRIADWPGTTVDFAPELAYGGPAKHMMFREPGGNRVELIHRP